MTESRPAGLQPIDGTPQIAEPVAAGGPVRATLDRAGVRIKEILPMAGAAALRMQAMGLVTDRLKPLGGLVDGELRRHAPWLPRTAVALARRPAVPLGAAAFVIVVAIGFFNRPFQLPRAPVAAATPDLPRHVARRLGEELELSVVPTTTGTTLFAIGGEQLASAQALSQRAASGDGIVVSVDALAASARKILAASGLDGLVMVQPVQGPGLAFRGKVPAALFPLQHTVVDTLADLLRRDAVLRGVTLHDEIVRDDAPYFHAVFTSDDRAVLYTADGPREIGQTVFGRFAIVALEPDAIVLRPKGGDATVTVPLQDPSAATVQIPALSSLPDRAAIVIDRHISHVTEP